MKTVYLILSFDDEGKGKTYKTAFTKPEYALQAIEELRQRVKERGDKKTIFYYSEINIVK